MQATNFIIFFPFLSQLSLHVFQNFDVGLYRYGTFLGYLTFTASLGTFPWEADDWVALYWSSALSPWLPKGFVYSKIRLLFGDLAISDDYRRP